MTSKLFHRQ